MQDFAENAPPTTNILVKRHPYDPASTNWRSVVGELASGLGIAQRQFYVEMADLDHLLERCEGVVTVNSSTGVRALAMGKPVKPLGAAHYAIEGLADMRALADFWNAPRRPREGAYETFLSAMWSDCLVGGGFHSSKGLRTLAREATTKMLEVRA